MSSPTNAPQAQAMNNDIISGSASHGHRFLIPSPIPTRRSRTFSASERAEKGPLFHGTVKNFCRQIGHGFIQPQDGSDTLFVHISDIDGEYVPKEGDEVTYKTVLIPPRNEKIQAVHVKITHLKPGVSHEKWDSPPQ
ncbi:calcium-regulated heat-stable protein 1-like [Haliotis cracherodii]|uniref:calcium-regulated heat-stable protein 1-like n=1 Tax=Haliotis cracherodii TaxID=6455 RepID=UPI0039EB8E0C